MQAKLTVSTPDDPQEKEADTVADKVMRAPEPITVAVTPVPAKEEKLERKEEEEVQPKLEMPVIDKIQTKEDDEEKVHPKLETSIYQRKEDQQEQHIQTTSVNDNNPVIHKKNISLFHSDVIQGSGRGPPQNSVPFSENLSASKGTGGKLPDDTRTFMESRFNADFSNVRVHTNSGAEQMNGQIQAQAFTHGNDIYFNTGKYSPDTASGKSLLAHELTHAVQQGASP